ncbi:hypothetical protein G3789_000196 [Listeria monocytogenes]|uniref:Uncharacterized protein n=1 Tax=Listeria monocytogenes TaxID=1639 RepID=A0A6C8E5Z9_LISMN|nr:hypothetical protein [Listeria monocytogenes]EEA7698172.1 hypothetical protein [Listeria monocytogenes]EEA8544451.1 hypothetical protein [Listeria monocytogenes]
MTLMLTFFLLLYSPMLSLAIPTPPEIQLTQTNETGRIPWRNHSLLKKRLLVG